MSRTLHGKDVPAVLPRIILPEDDRREKKTEWGTARGIRWLERDAAQQRAGEENGELGQELPTESGDGERAMATGGHVGESL